jgi:hypothetical protein
MTMTTETGYADEAAETLDHYKAGIELAAELPMTADPRRVVTLYAPRLVAAVEAATRLHSKWEIREDDGEGALERLICRHCCAADGGGQTEGCADEHAAGNCWPCPTYRAITAELAKGPGDAR